MQVAHLLSALRRFYTDAYDLFVIGIAKPMIATVYFPQLNGKLAKQDDLWITGVALVGTLVGQASLSRTPPILLLKQVLSYQLGVSEPKARWQSLEACRAAFQQGQPG